MSTFTEQWDAILARQPEDWSAMYLHLELRDAAQSEETALALSPLNPWHEDDWRSGVFRFRTAAKFGYGSAPELVRKRLGTLDAVGVVGTLTLTRRASDIKPVHTQGVV